MSEILAATLDYLARGWSVIPVKACSKRPIVECTTGDGGRHLCFVQLAGMVRNRAGIVPGIKA